MNTEGTAQAGNEQEVDELERQRQEFEAEQAAVGTAQPAAEPKAGEQETEDQKKSREAEAAQKSEEEAEGEVKKLSPKAQEHVNKKISKLVGETKAERESRHKTELENAELRGRLKAYEEIGKKPQETAPDPNAPNPEPKMDDFDTTSEFVAAHGSWVKEETIREIRTSIQTDDPQKKAQEDFNNAVHTVITKGRADYPDYDQVSSVDSLKWSPEMANAALATGPEMAHHVQYFLGKNPQEVERIKALPAQLQIMEIGAVKAAIAQSRKKPSTEAPKPVSTIKPQSAPASEVSIFDRSDKDIAEILAKRAIERDRA